MKTRLYLPFQQKNNEVISLRPLKDMIRYKHLVQFSFATSKMKLSIFFLQLPLVCMIITIGHTLQRL